MNPKQERFVAEYLVDLNATQAAIRAGYSQKTAKAIGCRLLTNADVAEAVSAGRTKMTEQLGVTVERIIGEYAKIAFSDTAALFDADGNLIPIHQLPKNVAAAISGLDVSEVRESDSESERALMTQTKKIKLWDKKGALDSLARINGMFLDKVEHSGSIDFAERLVKARERAGQKRSA